ncbi:hypothetical protein V6N12_021271 [Hibiscus sabdariffa]|uniref:Uncharacterized protein n=1 Tax=Hibiscus sabdariffa TaxID=183260 RepID=A0ABR2FRC8_9ROSI
MRKEPKSDQGDAFWGAKFDLQGGEGELIATAHCKGVQKQATVRKLYVDQPAEQDLVQIYRKLQPWGELQAFGENLFALDGPESYNSGAMRQGTLSAKPESEKFTGNFCSEHREMNISGDNR